MDLASYLLKPVQRVGKYALLLWALVQEAGGCPARERALGELRAIGQACGEAPTLETPQTPPRGKGTPGRGCWGGSHRRGGMRALNVKRRCLGLP